MSNPFDFSSDPVFSIFYEINQIPRCSHDEKRIGEYLADCGRSRGLKTEMDAVGNVRISLPATPGLESLPKILLQGHMDMVCVKEEGSSHDFTCEPITMVEEDGWIRADETTLGADDGIGVAMGLALLDNLKEHPAIDLLITTSEEVGMDGALGMDPSWLDAKYLINIDSEEEGYVTCGCAGGCSGHFTLPLSRIARTGQEGIRIRIDGMRGGHSGMNILAVNTHAMKTMAELLHRLQENTDFSLYSLTGGTKHNAIPNVSEAVVSFDAEKKEAFLAALKDAYDQLLQNLVKLEPDVHIHWEDCELPFGALEKESAARLLGMAELIPHGVFAMNADGKSVQTSDNFAILDVNEDNADFLISCRSSSTARLKELQESIQRVASTFQSHGNFSDGYPAWEMKEVSPLRDLFLARYHQETGKDAEVLDIHAGLECALFAQKNPELDMISVGPDVLGAHTTQEKLSISSTRKTYEWIQKLIADIVKVHTQSA
ncbi:beta-Ala-His dipeptidase [Peptoniphilaceae bacterium SGI.137]|nr:beta-Ala-His dipeptidase [Peptoniphilaceae bacterium]MDY5841901.1 beta-Ala-His dipeptidase [Peptoniphilaceae bacterium]